MSKNTIKVKAERKYKMTPEELQTQQHVRRKGGLTFKSKKAYSRKEKHKSKLSW